MIDKAGARQYVKIMTQHLGRFLGAAGLPEANAGRGGETLDLQSLRVQGKTTIIEFFSPFCPPCLRLAPLLAELAQKRPDLAVRKVNINRPGVAGIDWQSPLAQQFKIRAVPNFMIFSANGKGTKGQAATKQVMDWLEQAGLFNK
jgi:thiol-disulfide isomerase/thioredoxin